MGGGGGGGEGEGEGEEEKIIEEKGRKGLGFVSSSALFLWHNYNYYIYDY